MDLVEIFCQPWVIFGALAVFPYIVLLTLPFRWDDNNDDYIVKVGTRYSPPSWVRFAIHVLKCGSIPKHIAFIMDGNRRHAKEKGLKSVMDGHIIGTQSLSKVLIFGELLGIREVTVFAFSIENFKRDEREVTQLMRYARENLQDLWEGRIRLRTEGVRVRMVGDVSLLPADIVQMASKVELFTKDHGRRTLTVAFGYTSRTEIVHGINSLISCQIPPLVIDENILEHSFWSEGLSSPDMLVRTGCDDQSRLSDFLLWQAGKSYLYFVSTRWPDFGFCDMILAVFYYQRHHQNIKKPSTESHQEITPFKDILKNYRQQKLKEQTGNDAIEI